MADEEVTENPDEEKTDDANDEAAEGQEEGEESSGGGKLKLIIFGLVGIIILAGVGIGADYFMNFSGMWGDESEAAAVEDAASAEQEQILFYEIPEMVINLSDEEDNVYLKLSISFEVQGEILMTKVSKQEPRIIDVLQTYLRELRKNDLRGSGKLLRLKGELLKRVNVILAPDKVNKIIFKNIVIQ